MYTVYICYRYRKDIETKPYRELQTIFTVELNLYLDVKMPEFG